MSLFTVSVLLYSNSDLWNSVALAVATSGSHSRRPRRTLLDLVHYSKLGGLYGGNHSRAAAIVLPCRCNHTAVRSGFNINTAPPGPAAELGSLRFRNLKCRRNQCLLTMVQCNFTRQQSWSVPRRRLRRRRLH